MPKIILADQAGFCTGVARAMKLLIKEAETNAPGSTMGPLVHNEEVTEHLKKHLVTELGEGESPVGNFVAIRTHGVTPKILASLESNEDIKVVNLTCARVKRVQKIAADLKQKGYHIFIFGDEGHPEVIGIKGWAGEKATIFSDPAQIDSFKIEAPCALIAQTTASEEGYLLAEKKFKAKLKEAEVFYTLCPETKLRREAAAKLAERVEAFVVIGSKTSANTKALYNTCRQLKPTCWINSIRELDRSFLEKYKVVGVTAGASTPPWTIKEAVESMENELEKNQEEEQERAEEKEVVSEEAEVKEEGPEVEEELKEEAAEEEIVAEEPVAEEVAAEEPPLEEEPVAEETEKEEPQAEVAAEEVMEEEEFHFDTEVKVAQVGEEITGKIARVTEEEVYVDIGAKSEAVLPVREVYVPEGKTLSDLFAPEDEVEVTVFDIDEQSGKVSVSHKRLARENRLKELEKALEDGLVLKAVVRQVVGAGMLIDMGHGIEGFMPGSLVDIRYIPDFSEFKGQEVEFKIIELDRSKGKLILSRKIIIEEEAEKAKQETLNAIEVGSTIKGTVKRLTDFGAFVDIGGIDGLVHISELSWDRVNHPSEVLKVNEEIDVKVLEVIPERERISLSIRKTQPDPWTKAAEDIKSGEIIQGKVTRLVSFGAFIEIKPGVEGLAHISQLADFHVNHPSEVLAEGEEVEVKVIEVKAKSKRISLSVKEAGGVMAAHGDAVTDGAENGNVTLGDVFGDLFDRESFKAAAEEPAAEEEEAEEPVVEEVTSEEVASEEEAALEEVAEEVSAAEEVAQEEEQADEEAAEESEEGQD